MPVAIHPIGVIVVLPELLTPETDDFTKGMQDLADKFSEDEK